jgi:hypothetical protein
MRNGISAPPTQSVPPINGRTAIPSPLWNSQSPLIGPQTNLSMPPPHMQQQPPSPSWNNSSIPHGFPATSYIFLIKKKQYFLYKFSLYRSRRPVPSLTNPMGNGNSTNANLILGNGNLPISQTKKMSSQNNFFSFLPSSSSTTNQHKYSNIPTLSNPLQRTPVMTNFIQTQNGQSPPPPPPHIINGNDIEQNFNVKKSFVSFHP